MKINIYVTQAQYDWVKAQPKGFVGDLISREMGGMRIPKENLVQLTTDVNTVLERTRVVSVDGKRGDGKETCAKCGALLPCFKGKCKYC
jgi:hypothetical protein